MKTRLSVIALAAIAMAAANSATASVAPPQPPLPNLDSRKSFTNTTAAVRLQVATASAGLLGAQVNGVRFQADARTGGARFLAAQRGFLTGVGGTGKGLSAAALNALPASDPYRVVKAFANEHAAVLGHDASQLNAAQVKVSAVTPQSGMRTVIWQQRLDDIPVYGALFVSHLTKNDELISVSSRLVSDLSRSASLVPGRSLLVNNPPLTAAAAARRAAVDLGETNPLIQLDPVAAPLGAEQKQSFQSARLNGETYAQLVWLPLQDDSLQLCWQVILTSKVRPEMYLTLVSAQSGNVLLRRCLTAYATPATFNVYTSDSPSPFSPGLNTPSSFQPPVVPRTSVTFTALNTNASPNGWINDGGNETRGNNVDAHLDRNDDDLPDLPRPQGNPNRVFDFPLDLAQSPGTYGDASVVNLFYWNNFVHDRMYDFGFTEAFGNFQTTNFNRGGVGNDAVLADGQDGGGVDNANFATPPDGIPGRMQMYIFTDDTPDRDGSLDAEVMIHEYGHGISNRLLGGGAGISELQTAGMGEGWSDFYALSLLSESTDNPNAVYATGGYVTHNLGGMQENYYFGIRRYPYCTDMSKNPLTFKDIDPGQADAHNGVPVSPIMPNIPFYADEVHYQGEVWCVTLWDVRANLIEKLGAVQGNKTMLQLVTDGLKLAPENATFLEARDGILLADEVLTGGDNVAELWYGFAKRGMGLSATSPTSDTTSGVKEAYDVPDYVVTGPTDGIFEIRITPAAGAALIGNTTNRIFVRVTDGKAVTNATVVATLSTGGTLNFANNGQLPDLVANDANYTANFLTPNLLTNVTLTMVITAPGKDSATNVVTYAIIPPPPNDFFTNAIKVPAAGSNYITVNQPATIESGEPIHAGVQSVVASLWWTYTPSVNGSVLVDTAGSQADTVVAVYTNNTLATLQPVVSTNDIGNRQQAYVIFTAKAGVAYRIAVASYDDNSTGTIRLAVTPGGSPDITAPSVTVTSPASGLTVATNRVVLVGTAIDPDPNPSGLQQISIRVNKIDAVPGAGDYGSSASAVASLISTNWSQTVGLFQGVNQISVSVKDTAGNQSSSVILNVTYRPLDPPNDFFVNAITLTGAAGTNAVNTLQATKEANEPVHAGNAGGKSAWWTYQPTADGRLILSTTNSSFDTLLALYTGSSLNALKLIAANDDAANASGGASTLVAAVRSNQVYRIAVDGFDGAGGAAYLQYSLTPGTVYRLTIATNVGGTVLPGTMDVLAGATVQVTAQPAAGYNFDSWSGDVVSLANPINIVMTGNRSLAAQFLGIPYTDGFESGNFTGLGWTTGGSQPWIIQSTNTASGTFAARSGVIGANQTSSLFLSRSFRAGVGAFGLRVSSESTWDVFAFYVDGVLQQQWSGELAWTSFGFPITAGTHTLEWRYSKDANNSTGLDAAFIDNVNLPIVVPLNASTPARLTARRQTDGLVFLDVLGQTNQLYNIQVSTNLVNWQTLSTIVTVNGFGHVPDPASLTNSVRFYRAATPVP